MKRLAKSRRRAERILINLLKQVFNEGSLVFNNVVVEEIRITILLQPPKKTLLDREKKETRR